jgi:hypothetical protein
MHAPPTTLLPFLIMIPLVVWRLYSRVRRSIGRQTLTRRRPWVTICLFPLLTVMLGAAALGKPALLAALAGGAAGGVLLGIYGLGKTKFEATPQGLFYTPNAHIGIALSVLFVGRVMYRMAVLYSMDPSAQPGAPDFAASPLTLGIFGLLAGYYVTYAVGLVRWRKTVSGGESRDNTPAP